MQQYFLEKDIDGGSVILQADQAFHVQKVMRMKPGAIIRVADRNKRCFLAAVRYQDNTVFADILEELTDSSEMKCEVTLIMGLIRQEKWDFLLQKASELGVKRIVPMISSRNVVKAKEDKVERKLERWNKITKEACEQCKRFEIAEVMPLIKLNECGLYRSELNLVAYENAEIKSTDIRSFLKNQKSVTIVIGPEGGFSEEEIKSLEELGFFRCSLGKRIYRAETAAIFSLAAINVMVE